ncbi:hypothetical protein DSO57_1013357 [Entomophthora muscae]|uniref:Uncharacterized protein n=1 Tax=Entomophthora muscae TaxID=34485 RepID=A0ACC2UR55_9FUNG|nr:hypothetical protein DSO57_1013357 [Entomophthora muscae]
MDYITQLPSSAGFDAILVVVDCFSKEAAFCPYHTTVTAKQTAKLFFKPPACRTSRLQIFGLEPEQDLILGNPPKLDESKSPTLTLPTLKVSVNSTNQQTGLAIDPEISWTTTKGEIKKLPIERKPPRDDQPHDLTRKFEYSQFKPANELTPAMDATKDWKTLVDGNTWAKEIFKSLPMTDGHANTLDCQEVAHCHSCNIVT